jgi:hypothetical protein
VWGYAAHPLLDGDRLICLVGGSNSAVVAFHKDTGKEFTCVSLAAPSAAQRQEQAGTPKAKSLSVNARPKSLATSSSP